MTRCPSCNHLVVFAAGGGKLKVRTSMLVIRKGENDLAVEIVCRRCGGSVPMELEVGAELEIGRAHV